MLLAYTYMHCHIVRFPPYKLRRHMDDLVKKEKLQPAGKNQIQWKQKVKGRYPPPSRPLNEETFSIFSNSKNKIHPRSPVQTFGL